MAKIKHIAISSNKPDETAAFYKKVFDLEEVGRMDNEEAEGYYLTDGTISLAILRYKDEVAAREGVGPGDVGLHHIGFQVDSPAEADTRLRNAGSEPMSNKSGSTSNSAGNGQGGRNLKVKYTGPDGVLIDVSRNGWVGT